MPKANDSSDVHQPIFTAPKEVQQIIERVLEIEKDRLDKNERSPINDEILKIIKESVQ
ncbi:MAG: hypothetical protein KME35_09195 [Aphanocapsa sp. GSE-SYN-MK-11-07L]|jgi:hypothetical protein|nr:hypothetical protein [Aphanocapsa sp. GSE-SYN-MK-11-07L]